MTKKACQHCGKDFYMTRKTQKFCSKTCSSRACSAKNYERKKATSPVARTLEVKEGDCPFAAGEIHDVELFGLAMCCPGDTLAACHA